MAQKNNATDAERSLLFYDIEVFKYDFIIVFKDINFNTVKVLHNNNIGLRDIVNRYTLVGFNNHAYDDYVLSTILRTIDNTTIKARNDKIIGGEFVRDLNPNIKSLDVRRQLPENVSLKQIEGNLGKSIIESSISFDIDRPLTEDEIHETIKYCAYDVDNTIITYQLRKNYFTSRDILENMLADEFKAVDMVPPKNMRRQNTTKLSETYLTKYKPSEKWARLKIPDHLYSLVPPAVADMWQSADNPNTYKTESPIKAVEVEEFGNVITFSMAGLHGAPSKPLRRKNVIFLDVTSMYPNIIIKLNVLKEVTDLYKKIVQKRIAIKHQDKLMSDALKLVINSVYGLLRMEYSKLYNPKAGLAVCVYGQIAIFDLCRRLALDCDIININTDGVGFVTYNDRYKTVWAEWENDFGLKLEEKRFKEFIQKDVNNYIAVKDNNEIVTKGADVKRYLYDNIFSNNDARIEDIALVEYLLHGTRVLDTLVKNLDKPALYQYILKSGSKFQGVKDEFGNIYNKVNRIFAATDGVCLKKYRDDREYAFPDAPEKMYIYNGDCSAIDHFKDIVDLNHYYQNIKKKIERWEV